jgi:hypothetical protein
MPAYRLQGGYRRDRRARVGQSVPNCRASDGRTSQAALALTERHTEWASAHGHRRGCVSRRASCLQEVVQGMAHPHRQAIVAVAASRPRARKSRRTTAPRRPGDHHCDRGGLALHGIALSARHMRARAPRAVATSMGERFVEKRRSPHRATKASDRSPEDVWATPISSVNLTRQLRVEMGWLSRGIEDVLMHTEPACGRIGRCGRLVTGGH